MAELPQQLRKTLTWDRGKELSAHAQFAMDTGTQVFLPIRFTRGARRRAEPAGLLRQYFPKGTDLSRWSAADLEAIAYTLNNRPRKALEWRTPAESLWRATTLRQTTPVLHRPIEPAQYTALTFGQRLAEAGIAASIGSVGDSYDNALAESVNADYKNELVDNQPLHHGLAELSLSTANGSRSTTREPFSFYCRPHPDHAEQLHYDQLRALNPEGVLRK